MTAKMSNRGDNTTEANLQADGLRAADRQDMEEEDSFPITCRHGPMSRGRLQAISI